MSKLTKETLNECLEAVESGDSHLLYDDPTLLPDIIRLALQALTPATDAVTVAAQKAVDAIDFTCLGGEAQDAFMELEQALEDLEASPQPSTPSADVVKAAEWMAGAAKRLGMHPASELMKAVDSYEAALARAREAGR